ncbi:NfeD family protein [Gordonibacter sp. Marseille-P4307]|uniref:NfeD family protein n=1 Tax=Gordonibacter sp. Marseille-P4307 TaxID=2161815 RepID=UPI000F5210B7|nr:NfeD family protein [Gordonibacter sp. Marseille-P4307]
MDPNNLWLGVALIMGVIEAGTISIITVWFVVGALAAYVVSWFGANQVVQALVFAAISIACLLAFRPLVLKHLASKKASDPTPVGQCALVTESIDAASHTGRVETPDRMSWSADSCDGSTIPAGTKVRIVEQRSIRLVVQPEGADGS